MPKSKTLGWFRYFVWVQATVLMVAAVLKGWLLLTDSFADLRTGYPTTILFLAIAIELGAAVYLVFGRDLTIKWLVLAGLFGLFLAVSAIRYSLGIAGCGCLGSVELPRWLLPLNSALVLAGLFAFARYSGTRPLFRFRETLRKLFASRANPTFTGRFFGVGICLVLILLSTWFRSHPEFASLLGKSPIPAVRFSVGDLVVEEQVALSIPWRNCTSEIVTVLGSQSSCNCISLSNSHVTVGPSEQIELKFQVRPHKTGFFHQRIVCFVNHTHQRRFVLDVVANAVLPQEEN